MKRITSFLLAIVLFAGLVLTGAPMVHAASELTVSDALISVLKREEGFSAKPYWDYGQYTVGYGTRCPDDMLEEYRENGISEKEAEVLLRNYLSGTEKKINKFIDKYALNLTQNQFDALVTFTYNVGSSWISDTSGTFHNAIKKGTAGSELIRAFSLWCNAGGSILPGLVRRRLCEANMYLNGEYSITKPSNYCYVYYNANGGSVSYRIQGYDANEGVAPAYKAAYSGHEFLGWYTAKTGGEKVTKLTKSLSGDTLYARWSDTDKEQTETTTPATAVTVQVTASDVNLRKGPGTNYTIVGTADKGDELVITETASGSGYEWGKAGEKWIALKYTNYDEAVKALEKVPEESTEATETTESTETTETTVPETTVPESTAPAETKVTGTVKANGGLAVRKGPGTGYDVVKYLSNGAKVTILEQQKVGTMTWGKISSGWISMTYVVLDETEPSVPETTVPEATVPETTVPETTVPETTVPETTVPETTVPETTVPETTAPETTVPETTAPVETKLTGKVKASGGLAVRKGAGTNYARVKYLKDGTSVTITELKEVKGTKWGKISSGWICMDYVVLKATQTTSPETTKPETTKPETTKPETTEPEATVPETTVPETTVPETTVPETTVPTATEPGSTALTGKVKVSDGLSVRKGPGTNYAIKKYLNNGTKVTITEVKEVKGVKWGKISSGWICMDYVVLDGQTTDSAATKTVTADCLNVRSSASTSAKIVGYYYEGAKVTILETTKAGGITWGKTSKGWISMQYVK